jgi:hypothetical protein
MHIFSNRFSGLALRAVGRAPDRKREMAVRRLAGGIFLWSFQVVSRLAKRTSSLASSSIRLATLPSETVPLRKADPTA